MTIKYSIKRNMRIFGTLLAITLPSMVSAADVVDTQQVNCYNHVQQISCPTDGQPYYGQDGNYLHPPRLFTKLDPNGTELPLDTTYWTSVRDGNTGLVWEVKSKLAGDNTYTRCDTNTETNHGDQGDCPYNNSESFIEGLNASVFGGRADWRIPTAKELLTLVHWGTYYPAINTSYFPNTQSGDYLTSNYHTDPDYPGPVVVNFKKGDVTSSSADEPEFYIRAVSGTNVVENNFTVHTDLGNTVITDNTTGLMWMGEVIDDPNMPYTCPLKPNWYGAIDACESSYLLSYRDWRLPTINELLSIVNVPYSDQILPPEFSSVYGSLYSSTTSASSMSTPLWLNTYYGTPDATPGFGSLTKLEPSFTSHVLCVRGGSTTRSYNSYDISLAAQGAGKVAFLNGLSGQLTICEDNCTLTVQEGTTLLMTAISEVDSSFSAWSGDCLNDTNECTLLVDSNKTVSAAFSQNGDMSGDGRRGLEEVIIILRELTEGN